jgi:hypothetical protein
LGGLAAYTAAKEAGEASFFEIFKTLTDRNRIAGLIRALLPASVRGPVLDQLADPRRLPFTSMSQQSAESLYLAVSYEPMGPHPSDGLQLIISRLIGSFWMAICCLEISRR